MDEKQFYIGVLQLIDISSKRGCWEGSELKSVGILREELVERLKPYVEPEEESSEEE